MYAFDNFMKNYFMPIIATLSLQLLQTTSLYKCNCRKGWCSQSEDISAYIW